MRMRGTRRRSCTVLLLPTKRRGIAEEEKCLVVAVEEEHRRRRSVSPSMKIICRSILCPVAIKEEGWYEINALLPPRKAWLPVEKN